MQGVVVKAAFALVAFAATLLGVLNPRPGTIKPASAAACSEVTIGAVLSLTGERSADGIQVRNGYEYARRRLNKAGGIPVQGSCRNLRVIYYDDESSAGRAAQLTERLIVRDRVRLLLGPSGHPATEAVAAVAERHQVPLVSIAGYPGEAAHKKRRFHFAIDRAPDRYRAALAEYAARLAPEIGHEPGDLRLALLHDPIRAGHGEHDALRARARRLGIRIAIDRQLRREAGDITQALANMRAERPEIVFLDATAATANRAIKRLREIQFEPAILAMPDCATARVLSRLGEKAERILCIAGWGAEHGGHDSLFISPAAFADDYKKRRRQEGAPNTAEPVAAAVAQAAVAVRVLASAIKRAGTLDHFQVRDALATTDLETIIGRVTFETHASDGEHSTAVIRQILDGRYVTVWPKALAKGTYRWPASVQLPF